MRSQARSKAGVTLTLGLLTAATLAGEVSEKRIAVRGPEGRRAVRVEQVILANLGAEHVAQAVHRRAAGGDIAGDGEVEIVVTEAEIPDARLAVFHQGEDTESRWRSVVLDDTLYAADEIQLQKFPDMEARVAYWRIEP